MHPIKKIKSALGKIVNFVHAIPIVIKLISIVAITSLAITVADMVVELLSATNNVEQIYATFDVEKISELVEIKKSEDGSGYYLDFVEDFDEKIDKIINDSKKYVGLHIPPSKEFLKKIIKAEAVTQFPNLRGNIPEGSNGFQGAINIRRVTPNKEIGSIDDNPGRGSTNTLEPETEIYDVDAKNQVDEEVVKQWEEGKKLVIKYKAKVYEQMESKLNPGSDTGIWTLKLKEKTLNEYVTIPAGTEVKYTGTYKKNINSLTNYMTIYVEVDTPKEGKVFVESSALQPQVEEKSEQEEINKIGSANVSSRAGPNENTTAGKERETYTIAIAAGHNNTNNTGARSGDLIEEKLTIKTAEKVEELLSKYKNIKVVQVGSTSENPGGIQVSDRTRLAREANPDLCIQIHYDAGGGSGVQAIYKDGDNVSRELAEFLSDSMSESMGLPNKGAGPDTERAAVGSLGIIENAATSGFPSVVTEGGFVDGNPDADLLRNNGTDLCAQGIVDGILKYLKSDHEGFTATQVDKEISQESIDSWVYNLKYVEPEELEKLIEQGNIKEALKVFTLDEDKKLITVTWSVTGDGNIQIRKNAPMNFETSLQKYIMPYEYLLYFYIDTNDETFPDRLADEVLKTEIVIAIQDNVTTTKTVETTKEKVESNNPSGSYTDFVIGTSTVITETCTPKIEVTYADTWCVKYYKENSYSNAALGWDSGEQEEELNISGKSVVTESTSSTPYTQYGDTKTVNVLDVDGREAHYTYTTYRKVETKTTQMNITYDSGEAVVEGNENKFVKIYKEDATHRKIRDYLFMILERNERTANLVDLTKYLMYKATSIYYGVAEYDFNEFDINRYAFMGAGGGYSFTGSDSIVWKNNFTKDSFVNYIKNLQIPNPSGCSSGSGLATNQQGWDTFYKECAEQWFDICTSNGIDPIVIMSWSLNESGYGTSRYAQTRGNLWGWGANDSNPDNAHSGSGNTKAAKAMNLLEAICQSLKKTIDDPNYTDRYNIAVRNGASNPDLTTIGGTAYWYCSDPEGWIKSCTSLMKTIFGDFISQYCSQVGDSSMIGEMKLTGDNAAKMIQLINDAIRIANDDRYTYSQPNRYGEYQYDCSSLVARLYKKHFGITVPAVTADYGSQYRIGREGSVELQPGDVFWRKGHVEMYIGNGQKVGAHTNDCPIPDQISVDSYKPGYFTYVYRFIQ